MRINNLFSEEILIIGKNTGKWHLGNSLEVFEPYLLSENISIKIAFNSKTDAFVSYRYIVNSSENNYVYLNTNKNYELLTGFNRSSVIGKMVTEVVEDKNGYSKELIKKFYDTAVNGNDQFFKLYSEVLEKDYLVYAYSPRKYFFNVISKDLSDTNKTKYQKDMHNFLSTLDSLSHSDFAVCERQNPLSGNDCKIKIISKNIAKRLNLIDKKNDSCEPIILTKRDGIINSSEIFDSLDGLMTDQFSVLTKVKDSGVKTKELLIMT